MTKPESLNQISGSCKSCAKKHHSLLHLPPLSSAACSSTSATPTPAHECKLAATKTLQSSQLSSVARLKCSPSEEHTVASPPVESSLRADTSRGHFLPSSSRSFADIATDNAPSSSYQSAEVNKCQRATVLLSTAVIKVKDANNNYTFARALLDSGSQPSFISESLCQKLQLKRTKLNSPVSGIGQSTVNVHYGVTLHLSSRFDTFTAILDCLVLPKLTVSLPSHHIDVSRWRIPRNLPLADPQFNISRGVDIIIGAALFFDLLEHQQILLATGYPSLQKTVLGYIVCGKVEPPQEVVQEQCSNFCVDGLDAQLERFWEMENFDEGKAFSPDEQYCEEHFKTTVQRDDTGRYVVRLPLKEEKLPFLGDSYSSALRRFQQMERKFVLDPELRNSYQQFMEEYERLGHMELSASPSYNPQFYLPHHSIQRPDSSTTKTRVVFDGSCHGSAQLSLNEVLYVGPTVQPALYSIVINFRLPRFAITADAEKMFRQIWVHPEDRKFQQIVYRKETSEPIRTYQLKTVTYGLASSPFHATRVLNQLAIDEGDKFPLARPVVLNGIYVDDVITGHDDLETLSETCTQLNEMLHTAGFLLRKWASNCSVILNSIPEDLKETASELELDRSPAVKTLGLLWFPQRDAFKFKVPVLSEISSITKRTVVSEMSQLFDPLGLLGPVIVNAKIMKSDNYIELLDCMLIPFTEDVMDNDFIFQQDNAAIHVSKVSKQWFSEHDITLLEWPARSPDLNPIENL
ncbi:uncharacterized protein LOC134222992 [Armigeres subalbatus]|uniref:uncharacterized protein LOC134222992 n=1 Tax=Armigeres subalbatus TaxID=124917 RepID=UPI002ED1E898